MFDSQTQWFDHELQFHRKQWACSYCAEKSLMTRPELESHLAKIHGDSGHFNAESCKIARIDAVCCILCDEYAQKLRNSNQSNKCDVSLKQFQQHLGGHMEQLAFAALPHYDADEDAQDEDEESEEQNAEELLQELKSSLGSPYPRLAFQRVRILVQRYSNQERFLEVESLLKLALEISDKSIETDYNGISDARQDLTTTLLKIGKVDEAETTQRQVVDEKKNTRGERHLSTLESMELLTEILTKKGKLEEAENIILRVIDGRLDALTVNNPLTLDAMSLLLKILAKLNKFDEAEGIGRQIVETKEVIIGPGHPDTLESITELADILLKTGSIAEAEGLLRRVVTRREKIVGEKGISTLEALAKLAIVCEALGNLDEAETLCRRIFADCQETIGTGHPFTEQAGTALKRLVALRKGGNISLDKSGIAENVSPNPSYFTPTAETHFSGLKEDLSEQEEEVSEPKENPRQNKEKGTYPSRVTQGLGRDSETESNDDESGEEYQKRGKEVKGFVEEDLDFSSQPKSALPEARPIQSAENVNAAITRESSPGPEGWAQIRKNAEDRAAQKKADNYGGTSSEDSELPSYSCERYADIHSNGG